MDARAGSKEWLFPDGVWEQNADSGEFSPREVDGRPITERLADGLTPAELATVLGAKRHFGACTSGKKTTGIFPRAFTHCPHCGQTLVAPMGLQDNWLPPFGGDQSKLKKPEGLRLTAKRFPFTKCDTEQRPDREISLPSGNWQFLVAAFGTRSAALYGIDPHQGKIERLATDSERGSQIAVEPIEGGHFLPESSLPPERWAPVAENLAMSGVLWLPTDSGIARLDIDPIALAYRVSFSGGRCVAAPARFRGALFALMETSPNLVGVFAVPPDGGAPSTPLCEFETGPDFNSALPLVTDKALIWPTSSGRVVVRPDPGKAGIASILPWPTNFEPRFDLSQPHFDTSGKLWQQGMTGDHWVFVEMLGRGNGDDHHETDGPRLCTGSLSYRLGSRIRGNPWDDLEPSSIKGQVFPLLESDHHDEIIAAVVESTDGVDKLLDSNERYYTRFAFLGDGERYLLSGQFRRPWLARMFLFDRHLYLSHENFTDAKGPVLYGFKLDE